jgi:hypothetical protein
MEEGTVETLIALGSNFRLIMLSDEEVFAIFIDACQNDRISTEFFAKNFPFSLAFDFPQGSG